MQATESCGGTMDVPRIRFSTSLGAQQPERFSFISLCHFFFNPRSQTIAKRGLFAKKSKRKRSEKRKLNRRGGGGVQRAHGRRDEQQRPAAASSPKNEGRRRQLSFARQPTCHSESDTRGPNPCSPDGCKTFSREDGHLH